ncbi:hypothetical protein, partial [Armatimonas sp.]|uniref:hypothetical protein n=1 Tax=Armatimonas sp. TaxID=1872638 RepID=UPI0037506D1B
MHYPEFDALCHEVAGKLSELRRLTMETVILTDDQEALLAELTRLLRLTDAASSQQIHSLLGDTTTPDSAFLAELRDELPLLASPAVRMALSPRFAAISPGSFLTIPSSPSAPSSREEGLGEMAFPLRVPLTSHDPAVRFAHCGINGVWWAIAIDNNTALRFDSRADLDAYLAIEWQTERESHILRWPPEEATTPTSPPEVSIPEGMLELTYWDIRPAYPDDFRLLFARDAENKYCLIVT